MFSHLPFHIKLQLGPLSPPGPSISTWAPSISTWALYLHLGPLSPPGPSISTWALYLHLDPLSPPGPSISIWALYRHLGPLSPYGPSISITQCLHPLPIVPVPSPSLRPDVLTHWVLCLKASCGFVRGGSRVWVMVPTGVRRMGQKLHVIKDGSQWFGLIVLCYVYSL